VDDDAAPPRPPLVDRLSGGQWLAVDCAGAAVGTAAVFLAFRHGVRFHTPVSSVTAAFGVAATAPVALRRIWPIPVLAVVAVGCSGLAALGKLPNLASVMLGMAAYMAAARYRRPLAAGLLIAAELVLSAGLLAAAASPPRPVDWVRSLVVCGAMWFVGDSVRERRRYLAGLAEQADQQRLAEADRGQLAAREERVRIARELHDVVAHTLSMVTIQAGVGRKVGADRPVEALRALRAVELSGRAAVGEMRRILGLLRDDDTDRPSLAPVPGIGELGELAAAVRSAGISVDLDVSEDAALVAPATGLSAYRIVQEALTNAVKHAPGARAQVRVRARPDGVAITVINDGPARVPVRTGRADGHGIVGMRERAAAFGGTLDAGPLPGGGFRVEAFLPVSAPAADQVA
jgi:signal transduction histidine kinase